MKRTSGPKRLKLSQRKKEVYKIRLKRKLEADKSFAGHVKTFRFYFAVRKQATGGLRADSIKTVPWLLPGETLVQE